MPEAYLPALHCAPFTSFAVLPFPVTSSVVLPVLSEKFPAVSRARAERVCNPLDVVLVSHRMEYGAVRSTPMLTPSSRKSTSATPTLSPAWAETVTELPATVEPDAGAVMDALGAVTSSVVADAAVERRELWPAASYAMTA